MAHLALLDPVAPWPKPVRGWFDTDQFTYAALPDGLVPVPDAAWARREAHPQSVTAAGAFIDTPPPTVAAGPRYVSLATIRERIEPTGKWSQFAAALDTLPADKRWHMLTLREGVASDDADAVVLLAALGLDPAVVLA